MRATAPIADEKPPQRLNVAPTGAPAPARHGGPRRRGRARGVHRWRRRRLDCARRRSRDIVRPICTRFTTDALDAYRLYVVEVRHPVEVPGDQRPHLVQWLSKRLGSPVRAPELEKMGLKLVGGRLLPGPTGATAFFMYEGSSGERFTLYCGHTSDRETALRYTAGEQNAAYYWVDSNLFYVLSGPAERDKLHEIAQAAYDQIDTRPAAAGRLSGTSKRRCTMRLRHVQR